MSAKGCGKAAAASDLMIDVPNKSNLNAARTSTESDSYFFF